MNRPVDACPQLPAMFVAMIASMNAHGAVFTASGASLALPLSTLHDEILRLIDAEHIADGETVQHAARASAIRELCIRVQLFTRISVLINSCAATDGPRLQLIAARASELMALRRHRQMLDEVKLTAAQNARLKARLDTDEDRQRTLSRVLADEFESLAIEVYTRQEAVQTLSDLFFDGAPFLLQAEQESLDTSVRNCDAAIVTVILPSIGGDGIHAIEHSALRCGQELASQLERVAKESFDASGTAPIAASVWSGLTFN